MLVLKNVCIKIVLVFIFEGILKCVGQGILLVLRLHGYSNIWVFSFMGTQNCVGMQNFMSTQFLWIFTNLCKLKICVLSPAENQFDLEMAYKVFFFSDSCMLDLANEESN